MCVDDIYEELTVIVKGDRNYVFFHARMNVARIDVEHDFGLTTALFKRLTTKHTWHILSIGNKMGEHCSLFLMVNVYTCICGNKTIAKCWMKPIYLNEYLDVSQDNLVRR